MTWFRSLSECRFVPMGGELDPEAVAERIAGLASAEPTDPPTPF